MKRERRIIINIRDLPDQHALERVLAIVKEGKISGNGKSYCYHSRFKDNVHVSTREPRKNSTTTTFYVYEEYNQ